MANGNQQFEVGDVVFDRSIGREVEIVGFDEEGNPLLRAVQRERPDKEPVPGGFLRTAAQGATLGFSDELKGLGAGIIPGGKSYTEARDAEREKLSAYRQANPGKAFVAEMAGGILTGGGLVGGGRALGAQALRLGAGAGRGATRLAGTKVARKVAPEAAKAVRVGGRELTEGATQRAGSLLSGGGKTLTGASEAEAKRRMMEVAGQGGGLGSKLLTGAKIGGLEGAVYGAGSSGQKRDGELGESLKNRASGALRGGLVGAGFGVGLGTLAAAGGKLVGFGKELAIGQGGRMGRKQGLRKIDESIAISKMRENPRKFKMDGDEWVRKQQTIVENPQSSPEAIKKAKRALGDWEESGRSDFVAGVRALADDALAREANPGAVANLLGDSNADLAMSSQAAASVAGQQTGLLKRTMGKASRGVDAVKDTVRELTQGMGIKGRVGSVKKTADQIADEKRATAAAGYDDWNVSYKKKEWTDVITNAGKKAPEGYVDVIARIRNVFSPRGVDDVIGADMYTRLENAVGPVEEAARLLGKGKRKHPLNLETFLADPASARPRDVDNFRRALLEVKDQYAKEGTQSGNTALNRVDDLIEKLDDSIDPHSTKYRTARENYQVDNRRIEAYESGARKWNNSKDLAHAHETAWSGTSKRTQRNLTDAQKNKIRDEFKQGVIDQLVDDIDSVALVDEAGAMRQLEQRIRTIADAGLIEADVAEIILRNVETRALQAQTSSLVKKAASETVVSGGKVPEGATEATGMLYGLAGQAGAMGRTLVAGRIYTPAFQKEIAEAAARRLRQKESSGLMRVANTIKDIERQQLRSGLTRKGLTGGLQSGLISPISEDLLVGQKDFGYTPRDVARREELDRYGLLK